MVLVKRAVLILLAIMMLLAGCGGEETTEVSTDTGMLDCPSEDVLVAMLTPDRSVRGSPSPIAAAASVMGGELLPFGDLEIEKESQGTATVVVVDEDGLRIGRAMASESSGGWYLQSTERCG